jgi:hypothetical protein
MAKKTSGKVARAAGRALVRAADKRHPEYCETSSNKRHKYTVHKIGGFPVTYCKNSNCGRVQK